MSRTLAVGSAAAGPPATIAAAAAPPTIAIADPLTAAYNGQFAILRFRALLSGQERSVAK
ncbi:MAG TPA: hypothetical protein VFA04_25150 [Bryobacteraceae bacterium]|jgi:hypothetical protein|nr:hypothetical protein [Bryobacteraceae bacterium]